MSRFLLWRMPLVYKQFLPHNDSVQMLNAIKNDVMLDDEKKTDVISILKHLILKAGSYDLSKTIIKEKSSSGYELKIFFF